MGGAGEETELFVLFRKILPPPPPCPVNTSGVVCMGGWDKALSSGRAVRAIPGTGHDAPKRANVGRGPPRMGLQFRSLIAHRSRICPFRRWRTDLFSPLISRAFCVWRGERTCGFKHVMPMSIRPFAPW